VGRGSRVAVPNRGDGGGVFSHVHIEDAATATAIAVDHGQPGALFFHREGRLGGVIILDVADGQIQAVSSIVNPEKLRHLGPVADLRALLRTHAGGLGR